MCSSLKIATVGGRFALWEPEARVRVRVRVRFRVRVRVHEAD